MVEAPAAKVVRLFGGAPALAAALKLGKTQVYRWSYPKEDGGADGRVPSKHHAAILDLARHRGIALSLADLDPELARATVGAGQAA